MKRIKGLLTLFVLGLIIGPNIVNAASASISVKSTSQATVGSTITATVTLSSGSAMGSWSANISYDSSKLKLLSSNTENGGTGIAGVTQSASGIKSKSYTLKFKALSSGTANINVGSYLIYSIDEEKMSVSVKNSSIKIITKAELEASYSDDATLKNLSVEGYTLDFNSKTYEYNLEVENDVTSVKVNATKNNSNASVSGGGEITLNEGGNKVTITVTAQKGNSLTYTVNINRKELDPIQVSYEGVSYSIVRKSDELEEISNFELTEIDYEENKIPALKNETSDIILIGLKDDSGKVKMFIYKDGVKGPYEEIKSIGLSIIPEKLVEDKMFNEYKKETIEYNDLKLEVYRFSSDSKQVIFYGMNLEDGTRNYYQLDIKENTVSLFRNEINDYYKKQINNYKYVIYGLSGAVIALLIIVIFRKPRRKVKKNEE